MGPKHNFVKSSRFKFNKSSENARSGSAEDKTKITKKATQAIDGLPILDYPNNNNHEIIMSAERAFTSYVEKLFPYNGKIFKDGERHVFEEIEEPEEALTPENDPFKIKTRTLQKKIDILVAKKDEEIQNRIKVYSIIWNQLSPSFQRKIEESDDFKTIEEKRDDLGLWIEVQAVCLGVNEKSQNVVARKLQARKDFDLLRQRFKEDIFDYKERFIAALLRLEALEIEVPSEIEQAIIFVQGLDNKRFGEWKVEISNAQLRGKDIYPKTLSDAATQAANRKIAVIKSSHDNSNDQSVVFATSADKFVNKDNKKPDAKDKKNKAKDISKIECFNCHKLGHYSSKCPEKNNRSSALKKVSFQDDEDEYDQRNSKVKLTYISSSAEGYSNNAIGFLASNTVAKRSKTVVHLDNCAQVSIFFNPDLLTNIRPAKDPLSINGIGGTNAILSDKIADFKGFEVYYSAEANGNVLCKYDIMKKFDTYWDPDEWTWTVHFPDEIKKFYPRGKVWVANFDQNSSVFLNAINTVESNKLYFSKRDIAQAEAARSLMRILGYPSTADMIKMISNGSIRDCPVSVKDIHNADKIYGADIASLKGKTTSRPADRIVVTELVKSLITSLVLSIDIMFVSGIKFLLLISRDIKMLMVKHLSNSKSTTIIIVLKSMIASFIARGFTIDTIAMDGEKGLQTLETQINELGFKTTITGRGKHVPEVERAIRQIKERVRAHISVLPYTLPILLIIWLVYSVVYNINQIPRGDNQHGLSPRILFDGRKLKFNRDCKSGFGEYVQIHEENAIKNNMSERTRDAIFLKMRGNLQGTAEFLDLKTWRVVGRDHWTRLPIPNSIIELITKRAKDEGKHNNDTIIVDTDAYDEEPDNEDNLENDNQTIDETSNEDDANKEHIEADTTEVDYNNDNYNNANDTIDNNSNAITYQADEVDSDIDLGDQDEVNNAIEPPERDEESAARPTRSRKSTKEFWESAGFQTNFMTEANIFFTNMSIKDATSKLGEKAFIGIYKEMQQMIRKEVFEPIQTIKKGIPSRMFLKEKSDIVKARLVAGGHRQDRTIYTDDEINSPTVSTTNLFAIASIAAAESRKVITIDIVGAYLNAEMNRKDIVMELKPEVSSFLIDLKPEWKKYLKKDKSMSVIIKKAIYGCIESARLFNEHSTIVLEKMGFIKNPYDHCVLNKANSNGVQTTIAMHVDDWKLTSTSEDDIEELLVSIEREFKEIKINRGNVHTYLGINFDYTNSGEVYISMKDYTYETIKWWGTIGTAKTPAADDLFDTGESELLSDEEKAKYHSGVAKLLYLGKRTRPEILTALSYLTTRVLNPTERDKLKLDRLMRYLNGTKELGLRLTQRNGMCVSSDIDASFAVHTGAKSHGGVTLSIGEGTIYAKSSKIRKVVKSSTEAELVSCSDNSPPAINMGNFLKHQGYNLPAIKIGQDNKSTIKLIERGQPASQRTKHINISYFFLKDRIMNKEIEVVYIPTDEMAADLLTKPLQGAKFRMLRRKLLNERE